MRRISVAIFCLFTTFAPAQPAYEAVQTPLTIQPTHQLSFPDSPDIGSVAFSPDGKALYAHLRPDAVDVWAILVYVWPEELGAVVGIGAIVAGLVAWRVRKRPQKKGDLYCRRCNYELAGLPTGPGNCPECGVDMSKTRPRKGRGWWRRVGPAVAVVVVLGGAYGSMWAARLPRSGSADRWLTWNSTGLRTFAEAHAIKWLLAFAARTDRVVEVDTLTGQVRRTLFVQSIATWFPMTASPDGRSIVLSGEGSRLVVVDTRNGRVRTEIDAPGSVPQAEQGWFQVAGYSDDGRHAYAGFLDQATGTTQINECDLTSGAVRTLADTPGYNVQFPSGRSRWFPRRFLPLPGAPGPNFLTAPDFEEAYQSKSYVIGFVGPGVGSHPLISLPAYTAPMSHSVVTPDGARFFASAMTRGIVGVDLTTGASLGTLTLRPPESTQDELAISPDGDLLFVLAFPNSILVRRISAQRWVARLSFASGLVHPTLFVSPDGRWLAAVPFSAAGPTGPFLHEVLLFDLSGIPKPGSLETN